MKPKAEGASPAVLVTLENLISPGRRSRLSPYVEAAQLGALFGEMPRPSHHVEDARHIVAANEARVRELGAAWLEFVRSGKDFVAQDYRDRDFLDAYLAYYLSFNVPKLQLVLLDLVREGRLAAEELSVVDLGVGAGTTALAVLDFLVSWATACALVGEPSPVESVRLSGNDISTAALHRAEEVVGAYAEALQARFTARRVECGEAAERLPILERAAEWARAAVWEERDLDRSCLEPAEGLSLIVASNSLSECGEGGREHVRGLIESSSPGSMAVLVENGSEQTARWLMDLRRGWVQRSERLEAVGPCGDGLSGDRDGGCHACWMSRREAFHETALVRSFRASWGDSCADRRSWDVFDNRLLSWSYATLTVTAGDRPRPKARRCPVAANEALDNLTFLGSYWQSGASLWPIDAGPDQEGSDEYVKVCPAMLGAQSAVIHRRPGIAMPRMRFGERFSLRGGKSLNRAGRTVIELSGGDDTRFIRSQEPTSSFLLSDEKVSFAALDDLGYRLFGFPRLSPFQHRVVARALAGRSTLAIAATGAGKSECFILPAMLLDGITVVVSPLKALMADQYEKRLSQRFGLQHLSTFVNGDVPLAEREARLRRLEDGYYKLIYLTPEQLQRAYVIDALQRADKTVGLRYLALDEAHCISQWGHQFRPAYLNIWRRLRDSGLDPVRIALTATASPMVREDLCEELGLEPDPVEDGGDVLLESADRPELNLIVRVVRSTEEKAEQIASEIQAMRARSEDDGEPGAALVFMPWTGQNPEHAQPDACAPGVSQFAAYLERRLGTRVAIYHSKMDADEDRVKTESAVPKPLGDLSGRTREGEQARFMDGRCDVMVATKGFGMGIDKPNIRLVMHRTPPSNLEAYAQEAGRAGRDHKVADAILLYSSDARGVFRGQPTSDLGIQTSFVTAEYVRREDVVVMHAFLASLVEPGAARVYFTSDEALAFFDAAAAGHLVEGLTKPFSWPEFPPRFTYARESSEHGEVLDRGHAYAEKSAYVDRILEALYKFQPPGERERGRGYLEALAETQVEIVEAEVRRPDAILGSTHYFGRLFRGADVDEDELVRLLTAETVAPLADAVGLSLREAASVCRDIDRTDRGRLYRCRLRVPLRGPAASVRSAREWLDYAGATRRASKDVLEKRLAASRRKKPLLTDWFGEGQLAERRGWEVELGESFRDAERARRHLDEFMTVHDRRRDLDWRNFTRLLTEYVGVEEDGSSEGWVHPRNCLKSVLLGYLKTYETIQATDDKGCLSCSYCVKDEKFAAGLEERRQRVVKLDVSVIDVLDSIEGKPDEAPSERRLSRLVKGLTAEAEAGRSAQGYVTGWAMRVLTDHPGHHGAMWVELRAMLEGVIELQPERLSQHIADIAGSSTDEAELRRLLAAVAEVHERPECQEVSAVPFAQAALLRRLGMAPAEREALERVLGSFDDPGRRDQSAEGRRRLEQAVARLLELVDPANGEADAALFAQLVITESRLGETFERLTELWSRLMAAAGVEVALDYVEDADLAWSSRGALLAALAGLEDDVTEILGVCLQAIGAQALSAMPGGAWQAVIGRLLSTDAVDLAVVWSLLQAEVHAGRRPTAAALCAYLLERAESTVGGLANELASLALDDPSLASDALALCHDRATVVAWLAGRAAEGPLDGRSAWALASLLSPNDRAALKVCGARLLETCARAVRAGESPAPDATLLEVLWAAAELLAVTAEGRAQVLEWWPEVSRADRAHLARMGIEFFEELSLQERYELLEWSLEDPKVAAGLFGARPTQAQRIAALVAWAQERVGVLGDEQLAALVEIAGVERFRGERRSRILRRSLESAALAEAVFVEGPERTGRVMMLASLLADDAGDLDMSGIETAVRVLGDDEQALRKCGSKLMSAVAKSATASSSSLDDATLEPLWSALRLAWGNVDARADLHTAWLSIVSQLPHRLSRYCAWCLGCTPVEAGYADEAFGLFLPRARPSKIEYFFRVELRDSADVLGPRVRGSSLLWSRFREWRAEDLAESRGSRRMTPTSFESLRMRFEPLVEDINLPVCTACFEHLLSAVTTEDLRTGVAAQLHRCYVLSGRDADAKKLAEVYPRAIKNKAGARVTVKGGRRTEDMPWLRGDVGVLLDIFLKPSRK